MDCFWGAIPLRLRRVWSLVAMVFCGDAAGGFALGCGMALGWKSEDRLSS